MTDSEGPKKIELDFTDLDKTPAGKAFLLNDVAAAVDKLETRAKPEQPIVKIAAEKPETAARKNDEAPATMRGGLQGSVLPEHGIASMIFQSPLPEPEEAAPPTRRGGFTAAGSGWSSSAFLTGEKPKQGVAVPSAESKPAPSKPAAPPPGMKS